MLPRPEGRASTSFTPCSVWATFAVFLGDRYVVVRHLRAARVLHRVPRATSGVSGLVGIGPVVALVLKSDGP
jgi:hypothetical protein